MRQCALCLDKKEPVNSFVCHVCNEGFVCELCLIAWKKTGLFNNTCPTCRTPKKNKECLKTFYSFADPLFFFIFVQLCIIIKMFPLGFLALEAIMLCLLYITNRPSLWISNIHIILAISYLAFLFYWPHFLFSVWNFCSRLAGELLSDEVLPVDVLYYHANRDYVLYHAVHHIWGINLGHRLYLCFVYDQFHVCSNCNHPCKFIFLKISYCC